MKMSELEEGKRYRTFWGTCELFVGFKKVSCYYEELDEHHDNLLAMFGHLSGSGNTAASFFDGDEVARFIIEEVAA